MTEAGVDLRTSSWPMTVAHATDTVVRYPGEVVTLYTRVTLGQAGDGQAEGAPPQWFRLRVVLPNGLEFVQYHAPDFSIEILPQITQTNGATYLSWIVNRGEAASWNIKGAALNLTYTVSARVAPVEQDRTLESSAILSIPDESGEDLSVEERVELRVLAKGRYLKFLPSIYQEDDLMGRFLMLFESFLTPIEQQITVMADYFDPRLTPAEFLPWLASWTGVVLDENLSEVRRRRLLVRLPWLYRRRGTRQSLQEILEIYTGGRAQIEEHFSENFKLGSTAILGLGVALGMNNIPNTFSVKLLVPPVDEEAPTGDRLDEKQRARLEKARERRVIALIEAEKPAHTGYRLNIETLHIN